MRKSILRKWLLLLISSRFSILIYPLSPYTTWSSFRSNLCASVISCALAAVAVIVCTKPLPESTPMWHFIPNFHTFPFLVWYISGSRFFSAFLVELGAEIMVASTIVPPCMICPVASITRLIALKNTSPRWFSSSKWRNFRSVVASGTCSSIKSIFMNFRNA